MRRGGVIETLIETVDRLSRSVASIDSVFCIPPFPVLLSLFLCGFRSSFPLLSLSMSYLLLLPTNYFYLLDKYHLR